MQTPTPTSVPTLNAPVPLHWSQWEGIVGGGNVEAKNLDDELTGLEQKYEIKLEDAGYENWKKKTMERQKFIDDLLNKGFKDLYKFDVLEIADACFIYWIQSRRNQAYYKAQIEHTKRMQYKEKANLLAKKEPETAAKMLGLAKGGGKYANDDSAVVHMTSINAVLWHIMYGPDHDFNVLSYEDAKKLPNDFFYKIDENQGKFEQKMQDYIQKYYGKNITPGSPEWSYYNTLAFASAYTRFYEANAHVLANDMLVQRFFKKVGEHPVMDYWNKYNIATLGKKPSSPFWQIFKDTVKQEHGQELDKKIDYNELKNYGLPGGPDDQFHAKYNPYAATMHYDSRYREIARIRPRQRSTQSPNMQKVNAI